MTIDRRSFLKGTLALPAAAALPSLFARALLGAEPSDRILVLVQLDGGNDGLNTVVPFGDDAYYRARPGLAIAQGRVVRLDGGYHGLHPSLAALRGVWDDGALGVVQGVGYPNASRSHFTSTDVWHTARTEPQKRWTGWVGRALDRDSRDEVPAIYLDPGPLSLALVGERILVPSVADAGRFRVRGSQDLLGALVERPREGEALEYIRRSARQAYRASARIEAALAGNAGQNRYPATDLARRLWQVARMVQAALPARVYAVRLTGFDTHARQAPAHASLLQTLGDALGAFHKDLKAHGLAKRVLTMTYSEFGRRVNENRSLGTDHGAAAPMFVMSGGLKGGLVGEHPSLTDLEDGDVKHHTDFRQVYATILERWLKVEAQAVLGRAYRPVAFLCGQSTLPARASR
ncbi:MAG: DUF1501 domain-containing protein [Planctomycetota bacterium]|jgi:uncharacterized protein (DUF1501 family)